MEIIHKINILLAEKGISGAKMSRDLGLSNAVFSQWKNHKQNPSLNNVKKIANYFSVSIEYLLDLGSVHTCPGCGFRYDKKSNGDIESHKRLHMHRKSINKNQNRMLKEGKQLWKRN